MARFPVAQDDAFSLVLCPFLACTAHAIRVTEGESKKRAYESRYSPREDRARLTGHVHVILRDALGHRAPRMSSAWQLGNSRFAARTVTRLETREILNKAGPSP